MEQAKIILLNEEKNDKIDENLPEVEIQNRERNRRPSIEKEGLSK